MEKQNGIGKFLPQQVVAGRDHGVGTKGRSTDTMLISKDIMWLEGGESR